MSFPTGLLLIPYFLLVLLSLLMAVLNVYHLVHYGATTKIGFLFTFIFVAGLIIISLLSWLILGGVDWASNYSFSFISGGPADLPTF